MAKKAPSASARIVAANVLVRVLKNYQQLDVCLADALPQIKEARDRALTQELCYGVLRWLPQLQNVVTQLLDRPVRRRDLDVSVLLLLGLYQLEHTRIPAHAAVAETVDATRTLGETVGKWTGQRNPSTLSKTEAEFDTRTRKSRRGHLRAPAVDN